MRAPSAAPPRSTSAAAAPAPARPGPARGCPGSGGGPRAAGAALRGRGRGRRGRCLAPLPSRGCQPCGFGRQLSGPVRCHSLFGPPRLCFSGKIVCFVHFWRLGMRCWALLGPCWQLGAGAAPRHRPRSLGAPVMPPALQLCFVLADVCSFQPPPGQAVHESL